MSILDREFAPSSYFNRNTTYSLLKAMRNLGFEVASDKKIGYVEKQHLIRYRSVNFIKLRDFREFIKKYEVEIKYKKSGVHLQMNKFLQKIKEKEYEIVDSVEKDLVNKKTKQMIEKYNMMNNLGWLARRDTKREATILLYATKEQYFKANTRYKNILYRCYNPTNKDYKYYGAKGVKVCDEWKNDRMAYIEWECKQNVPLGWTIDRINSTGDYEPDNCIFIPRNKKECKFELALESK